MLDERDHLVGPLDCVVECRIVSIDEEKEPHYCKGSALVSLLESVCESDSVEQRYRQPNDVVLSKPVEISWPRQCAFEQPEVTDKVPLVRRFHLEPIMLDYGLDGQPPRLFGKGRSDLRVSRDVLAA